jgi:hypothetical protein
MEDRRRVVLPLLAAAILAAALFLALTLTDPESSNQGDQHALDNYGFLTRSEALARLGTVVYSGTRTTELRVGSPPDNTTYDLRGLTSIAYRQGETGYPLGFGKGTPPAGLALVGGTVLGSNPVSWTWQQWKATGVGGDGAGEWISAKDAVTYDFRADDVFDFIRVLRPASDSRYLIEGCYGANIHDDALENDYEASVTMRDCLIDGTSMGLSIGQTATNAGAVNRIVDSTFIFKAFPNTDAADGIGHQRFFKQLGAGSVVVQNVNICYPETPITPSNADRWMPGTYENVRVVLGPAFIGDWRGTPPAGVTISRDWSICTTARDAWLAAHPGTPTPTPPPS